ncbi:MAG TPA: hypothetical protein VK308_08890 [Pyrinomonadaceae bacterium]|nr:hypothetical protein [Pyrinomonadaceae bacterium]
MDSTQNAQFTTMLYSNRHLIIKTIEGKSPFVIAECYLPDVAAQICELLTDAAKNESTSDNTKTEK